MQHIVTCVAMILCASCAFAGALDALSRADVRVASHLREIDRGALNTLKRHFSDDDRRLADRGAGFEASDAVGPEDFPPRRLVLAARAGDTWFIHYEHGGRGYHSHLVALTRADRSWRLAYAAAGFDTFDSLPQLLAAIRRHQFEKTVDL